MAGARTQAERAWLVGGIVAAALVAVLSWFFVVSPKLAEAADRRTQTSDAQLANLALQRHVNDLKTQSDQLPAWREQLNAAGVALPSSAAVDTLTGELAGYATSSKVTITSIIIGTPAPVPGAAPAPAAGPGAKPVPNATGGLYSISITVVTQGPESAQQAFLHAVQYGPRAALVTSTALAPSDSSAAQSPDAASTMTVQAEVFVSPKSKQAEAQLQQQLGTASG
jgi:hypothetical protein